MSHHLDSPFARQDVRLDITDLYAFRGESGTAFMINVWHSITGAIPEPRYQPEGMYEFNIDLDVDAIEDITYRFKFDKRDAHGRQRYALSAIIGAEAADPDRPGKLVAEGITGKAIITDPVCACGRARPAIRSGSNPMCCTQSAMLSRTAPSST